MNKTIRLSGIAYESLVNGPGMRRVFFAQGCKHNCEGCFNPETHDFSGGEEKNIDDLIKDVLKKQFFSTDFSLQTTVMLVSRIGQFPDSLFVQVVNAFYFFNL